MKTAKVLTTVYIEYKDFNIMVVAIILYFTVQPDVWLSPNQSMYILNEGDDLSVKCKYSSNHDISELKWGRLLTMNGELEYIQSSPNLIFQNLKSENAGQYVCIVSNMVGNESETVSIEVHCKLYELGMLQHTCVIKVNTFTFWNNLFNYQCIFEKWRKKP